MNPTGALANSKASVQKLKNKRLTDFINDVAANIPDPPYFIASSSSSAAAAVVASTSSSSYSSATQKQQQQPSGLVRYKPFSLIDLEREQILKQYQLGDDEPPLLFVGRRTLKIRKDSPQLQEIVDSYMTFKELTIEADYQNDECPGFA